MLLRAVRDGAVESVHRGHVVIAAADATVLGVLGDANLPVYVRSAVKPLQALATLELLGEGGTDIDEVGLAISCASHDGSETHQVEAARLLAGANLDESALRCPPALPGDLATLRRSPMPTRLAHNCSGKHAAFLAAQVAAGGDPAHYLRRGSRLQRRVHDHLAEVSGSTPTGPGIDGCGAPAWLLPLAGLATGFARLAGARHPPLARVAAAMRARPDLVGGVSAVDTRLMLADARIVAKRGAEAVFAAGAVLPDGSSVGVAVKIADGGQRATAPVVGVLLRSLGLRVPADLATPVVLGGGRSHGRLETAPGVEGLAIQGGGR